MIQGSSWKLAEEEAINGDLKDNGRSGLGRGVGSMFQREGRAKMLKRKISAYDLY